MGLYGAYSKPFESAESTNSKATQKQLKGNAMSATYKEIKERLTDFGFEEDDVAESDYKRIYIDSLNHAGEIIYYSVILQIEDFIRKGESLLPTEDLSPISRITDETEDDDYIYIPDVVQPLYVLLAAHYAWLDDDLTKATIYWNEYDDLKNQIIATAKMPRRAEIIGGIRW